MKTSNVQRPTSNAQCHPLRNGVPCTFSRNFARWALDVGRWTFPAVSFLLSATVSLAAEPTPVKFTSAKRAEIHRWITLPGTLKPNQQATLYAKVAGYLTKVAVDKGDPVKAGQLLGELEVPELLADAK